MPSSIDLLNIYFAFTIVSNNIRIGLQYISNDVT